MQISRQFHTTIDGLHLLLTHVAHHNLQGNALWGFGLMSMILYCFGVHLFMYGTSSVRLSFIGGGMDARTALGMTVIQLLYWRDYFNSERLLLWLITVPPSVALACKICSLSGMSIVFPVSGPMFSICLWNIAVILIMIFSTSTMIKSFGFVILLFADDVMDKIIAIALKDHPLSTITMTHPLSTITMTHPLSTITMTSLLGCLIAWCGFVMYHWKMSRL